jgi:cytochrome c oxidase subunit I+III
MNQAEVDKRSTELHRGLDAIWTNLPGWRSLSAVNHSTIGLRFIVTGFIFMLVGGVLAMFMRLQLAWPDNQVLDAQTYNEFVTLHGTTMMFLFAVPIMEGFALYLIPKMIGARDVPFPRLSAFGYWCYLAGGLLLYSSLLFGLAPDGGWFMYVPLTGPEFTPDARSDFWLLGVTLAEISAVAAAIELVVAILCTRTVGMSIQRMPLFAWYILAMALMIVFGFPPLIMGSVMLEIERAFGFVFYDVARGGDPLLWQHLFWLFGHPEVYIIFLPAAGVLSTVIPTFAQRPIVGYSWVVLAVIGTAFLSFGLWVHHMYATGIPYLSLSFFAAASMAVAIPMGVQIFVWIATLWTGRPRLEPPMLFVAGFFLIFVLGGLTGVMVAYVPFDWQAHDTHFVVAHLHYVLIGGMMFPMFAAFYYWLPLWTGRLPSAALSRTAFWLMFIGFNVTFLPMHLTGLLGMTRRVYTYSADLGIDWLNLVSTIGSFVFAVGILAFALDFVLAWKWGHRAAAQNPWNAGTLEWATPVPPPNYNFASLPLVVDRDPLWSTPDLGSSIARGEHFLGVARDGAREMLGSNPLTGQPEYLLRLSVSSWWPMMAAAAVALAFIGVLAQLYWLSVLGTVALVLFAGGWLWTTGDRHAPLQLDVGRGLSLPIQYAAKNAPGWWGLIIFLLASASSFASVMFGYVYLWLRAPAWPPEGLAVTPWLMPALAAGSLALSALPIAAAAVAMREGATARFRLWMLLGSALGLASLLASLAVFAQMPSPGVHAYVSVSMVVLGFAVIHLAIALLINLYVMLRSRHGHVSAARPLEMRVANGFWQYSVAIGLIAAGLVHLFPRHGWLE